jgi:hypothetical protein
LYKNIRKILTITILVVSCSTKNNPNKESGESIKFNIINPYFIDELTSFSTNNGSIWSSLYLRRININQIDIVLKGGKNKNQISEKNSYLFNRYGQLEDYFFYDYSISDSVMNQFHYNYSSQLLTKIDIFTLLGMNNQAPVFVDRNDKFEYFLIKNNAKFNDTTFYYPSFKNPEIIIDKIGKDINHMEIIIDKATTANYFMSKLKSIDSTLKSFNIANKIITYTVDGLPTESYQLENNWNVKELIKKWEYNILFQPVSYSEWLHGTKIKDISVFYNENSLPKRYIFNKKKYNLIYKKI